MHKLQAYRTSHIAPEQAAAPRAHAKAWQAKHSTAWLRIMLKWGQRGWGAPRVLWRRKECFLKQRRDSGWVWDVCWKDLPNVLLVVACLTSRQLKVFFAEIVVCTYFRV